MIVAMHGDHVAFKVLEPDPPEDVVIVRVDTVILPDGTRPQVGSALRCGTCGRLINPKRIRFRQEDA